MFSERFRSTPRGARLARSLAVHQLQAWGIAPDTDLAHDAALVIAELTANAATHGSLPGRHFALTLTLCPDTLRIEVSDTRGEHRPPTPATAPPPLSESGRGLLLVESLTTHWEVHPRTPIGKTVSAHLDIAR
ncbi:MULTISPECIES: ATP-binding protein [Streptomyces]|uniref:ATP-binding protein n=1 Tax=Streptomyces TaxID=1883 RepID=UPI0016739CD2|nr:MULTISPECIES: ATP-binding protein [Streptomyces]MBD3576155.1 ATP-binding protein [Streptomyces sp. KD18]GGS97602.1 ATP-binding protein [Streptomyces toxytricini]